MVSQVCPKPCIWFQISLYALLHKMPLQIVGTPDSEWNSFFLALSVVFLLGMYPNFTNHAPGFKFQYMH